MRKLALPDADLNANISTQKICICETKTIIFRHRGWTFVLKSLLVNEVESFMNNNLYLLYWLNLLV